MIQPDALLRAAIVSVLSVLTLSAPWTADADAEWQARPEGVSALGIPSVGDVTETPGPGLPEGPTAPEVQAVWDLGAAGDWARAFQLLGTLERAHENWRPQGNLKSYLLAGTRDQDIRRALAAGDWQRVLSLLPETASFACEQPFHIWARADALEGGGEAAGMLDFYIRILTVCEDPELLAGIAERAAVSMTGEDLAALADMPWLAGHADPVVQKAYGGILAAEFSYRIETAIGEGDLETSLKLASASRDPLILTQAGWLFLNADVRQAAVLFKEAVANGAGDDARRGWVLAALAAGDTGTARSALEQAQTPDTMSDLGARIDLADSAARREAGDWQAAVTLAARAVRLDPRLDSEAQQVSGGALLDAAGRAYEMGDFEEARQLARLSAEYKSTRRQGLLRAAWSDLQLGDATQAANTFRELYLEIPETVSAEGYALAAERAGHLGAAAALARAAGGPLRLEVEARYAEASFHKGDYLTARAYAPDRYEMLQGLDETWYRQAVSLRQQGGARGENRLLGFVSTTSAGTARGANRYEGGLSVYTLDAGGVSPGNDTRVPKTFAAPYISWSREGDTSLAARVGLLPVGGGAQATLSGEAALMQDIGRHVVEVRAFSRPRTDSAYSLAGRKDASGDLYGRIAETGALLRGRFALGDRYAVQAEFSATRLNGPNAADNSMVSAGITASRSFSLEGLAYFVTGPFYQVQSYDWNTNFFTPGHGGYFSPQDFRRAGWSLNTQTDPLKRWIVKADAALAHETVEEDPAAANPLLPGLQPLIGGGRNTGIAGTIDFGVARKLKRDIIVSANASVIASQAYEDFRLGIAFVWVPGGRTSLTRADLLTDPFTPASWLRP